MVKAKKTTIYDIAERVHLSPATVSRVLGNSTHPVKDELREAVLQAAKELNYIPNAQARSLKTRSNPSIGIMIPSIDNPFYAELVRAVSDEAREYNYSVYLCNDLRKLDETNQHILSMAEQNVQGIIMVYPDVVPKSIEDYIARGGIVVALTGKNLTIHDVHNIQVDKVRECYDAAQYLISLGHRKIALLMNQIDCTIRRDKVQGYRNALTDAGITPDPRYFYSYGVDCPACSEDINDAQRGARLAQALLERSPEVTAIICMNDSLAVGAISTLQQSGVSVPGDYSVVGFDDSFFSRFIHPSLTTMALDRVAWGRTLMQYLNGLIESKYTGESIVDGEASLLEPVKLIARESTAAPRE